MQLTNKLIKLTQDKGLEVKMIEAKPDHVVTKAVFEYLKKIESAHEDATNSKLHFCY